MRLLRLLLAATLFVGVLGLDLQTMRSDQPSGGFGPMRDGGQFPPPTKPPSL